jgi:hypothetical protein
MSLVSLKKLLFRLKIRLDPDYRLEPVLIKSGDRFADMAAGSGDKEISVITATADAKIERIVSIGQVSAAGFLAPSRFDGIGFPNFGPGGHPH